MVVSGTGPQKSVITSAILHSLEAISVFSYLLQGPWCGAVNRLCMASLSLLMSEHCKDYCGPSVLSFHYAGALSSFNGSPVTAVHFLVVTQ